MDFQLDEDESSIGLDKNLTVMVIKVEQQSFNVGNRLNFFDTRDGYLGSKVSQAFSHKNHCYL